MMKITETYSKSNAGSISEVFILREEKAKILIYFLNGEGGIKVVFKKNQQSITPIEESFKRGCFLEKDELLSLEIEEDTSAIYQNTLIIEVITPEGTSEHKIERKVVEFYLFKSVQKYLPIFIEKNTRLLNTLDYYSLIDRFTNSGYFILEGVLSNAQIRNLRYSAKLSFLKKITEKEVLQKEKEILSDRKLEVGDIVEIQSKMFQKSLGKVTGFSDKNKIVITLINSRIPIRVTLRITEVILYKTNKEE